MSLKPANTELFFTKNDPEDPRLGEWFKAGDLTSSKAPAWVLTGYSDDEGIRLNSGRPGASGAPDAIRKYLYRMTPSSVPQTKPMIDLGNITPEAIPDLNDRHLLARQLAAQSLMAGHNPICLGGGHDYGFPDAAGFLEVQLKQQKQRPIVINFDAHLDVRPTHKGHHSGTPFRRLLGEFKGQFDFYEIGIQPQCNSVFHRDWATSQGAIIVDLQRVQELGLVGCLNNVLDPDPLRPVWISLDMDAFNAAAAPGCSQVFSTGLDASAFMLALDWLRNSFKICGIGIYEVSPPLDRDDQTSRFAATILHRVIFGNAP